MTKDLFSPFDPINGVPVTIVFGTFNYRHIIRKWIDHAVPLCDHWRIICLDRELVDWLKDIGYSTCAIYFFDLFPDKQYLSTYKKAIRQTKGRWRRQIFKLRKKLFSALVDSGRDFIHSDADAYWLKDPRPWLANHTEFDILISQGTIFPLEQYKRSHFVFCAGFFLCRSNMRTQNYFRQMEELTDMDDQESMNQILLDDPNAYWYKYSPTIIWGPFFEMRQFYEGEIKVLKRISGRLYRIFSRLNRFYKIPNILNSAVIWAHRQPLLRLLFRIIIYVNPDIIKGTFSNGLAVGIIPIHLVTRISIMRSNDTMIEHNYI